MTISLRKYVRLRVSMSNMLLLTLSIAIALGWHLDRRRLIETNRSDNALVVLSSRGADFGFDDNGNLESITIPYRACSTEIVALVRFLPTLRKVHLHYGDDLDDVSIQSLTQLSNLETLELWRVDSSSIANPKRQNQQASMTDRSLRTISTISSIKELYIWDHQFGDEGLGHLANLQNLETFSTSNPNISQNTRQQLRQANPDIELYLYEQKPFGQFHNRGYIGTTIESSSFSSPGTPDWNEFLLMFE